MKKLLAVLYSILGITSTEEVARMLGNVKDSFALDLATLESVVEEIRVKGINPNRESLVTLLAFARAKNIPVTARTEAASQIAVRRGEAEKALEQIPATQNGIQARIAQLNEQIKEAQTQGAERVAQLKDEVEWTTNRADQLDDLLHLIQ